MNVLNLTKLITMAVVALLLNTGCVAGPRLDLSTMPDWAYEPYATVAVVPFTSIAPDAPDAGEKIAAHLEDALNHNTASTVKVIPWEQVRAALGEEKAAGLRKLGDRNEPAPDWVREHARILIVGTCLRYETLADVRTHWLASPSYATDANRESIIVGEHMIDVDRYRHAATVEVELQVVESATGKTLHRSEPISVTARRQTWREPPKEHPDELAAQAIHVAALRLLREIAVTHERVRIPHDAITTTRRMRRGRQGASTTFTAADAKVTTVIQGLPPACDGQPCRLVVTGPDSEKPIVDRTFTWSAAFGSAGRTFELPTQALIDGGGFGRFRATLHVGANPVAEHAFRIRKQ